MQLQVAFITEITSHVFTSFVHSTNIILLTPVANQSIEIGLFCTLVENKIHQVNPGTQTTQSKNILQDKMKEIYSASYLAINSNTVTICC